ncbi:MAG: hypothetical protein NVSMB28_02730 [Collimonas sp.]
MRSRRRGFGATLEPNNGVAGNVSIKIREVLIGRGGSRELSHEAQFHAGVSLAIVAKVEGLGTGSLTTSRYF